MRQTAAMTDMVKARVSTPEKQSLRVAARRRGLTVSEFIRQAAIGASRGVSL